jgi:hypothetical protein
MKKTLLLALFLAVLYTASANLIANGNFDNTICRQQWCIFGRNNPNAVRGWTAEPEIEVGYAYLYNKNLKGSGRVVELGAKQNTCISQRVRAMAPGNYRLEVIYAARESRELCDSQFSIGVNGRVLKRVQPANYQVRSVVVNLRFRSVSSDNLIRLCGVRGSANNSFGAIIKEVRLHRGFGPKRTVAVLNAVSDASYDYLVADDNGQEEAVSVSAQLI